MKKNIIIVCLLLAVGVLLFLQLNSPATEQNNVTKQEAVDLAMDYINKYLVDGGSAYLVKIYESEGDAPLYGFQLNVYGQNYDSFVTADGKILYTEEGIDLTEERDEVNELGFYEKKDAQVSTEDGKPIIYFFGSTTCSHCAWEKPIIEEVAALFGDSISLHLVIDDSETDADVYSEFGSGAIPLVVLGGKYYREGSGESAGEEIEKQTLITLICELTNNSPEEICNQ